MFGICAFLTVGKQRIIEFDSKSITTLSRTLKRRFSSAIESNRSSEERKAEGAISTTAEGMYIDESDEQPENA
jgi:hypothetical protein